MNRDITFRAWDGSQMVYDGDYWNGENRQNHVPSLAHPVLVTNKGIHWCKKLGPLRPGDVVRDEAGNEGYTNWEIDRISGDVEIMENTGMKDIHGEKVFEGDIVTASWESSLPRRRHSATASVVFLNGQFTLDSSSLTLYESLEVLGNIHENPELLGGDGGAE